LIIGEPVVLEVSTNDDEPMKSGGEVKRVLKTDGSVFAWFELWETNEVIRAKFESKNGKLQAESSIQRSDESKSLEHCLQVLLLDNIDQVRALPRKERKRALAVLAESARQIEDSLEEEKSCPRPTLLSEYVKTRK